MHGRGGWWWSWLLLLGVVYVSLLACWGSVAGARLVVSCGPGVSSAVGVPTGYVPCPVVSHMVLSCAWPKVAKAEAKMRENPANVSYTDLYNVCEHYFGTPRQEGTSHAVFAMPWAGDPRVNIQNKKGKAKPYQVRQAIKAIDKMEEES